jgi:C4-type Zn-finger protein
MSDKRELPEDMNDADNYAYEHRYEWNVGGECPDCGGALWTKVRDMQDGHVIEVSVVCTNCGFQDVQYDG